MDFPWTGKCLTNGCENIVTRYSSGDFRFCDECRKEYGREMTKSRAIERIERKATNSRYPKGRDEFSERLKEGFMMLGEED